MCRLRRVFTAIVTAASLCLITGCAHYPTNPRLPAIDSNAGYRYSVTRGNPVANKPFVLLSFSGGGTRAAALSFGMMEELRAVEYTTAGGTKRHLIDDVEIISSVSGGSFTSAYYALFPDRFFTDFPDAFLYRNIQAELLARLFNPYNWARLASPDFSRIDMAEEYYGKTVFQDKTFADLIANRQKHVPFVVLNATDIGINHRFEFTQDQFDLLCSNLSEVAVSRAVAASSNFPVAFPPMTLDIYQNKCGALPGWIDPALQGNKTSDRRYVDAMASASYRQDERHYVHLLDGGISDNLGLRGPYQAATSLDSAWSILKQANLDNLGRLMVIAVNAKTTKHNEWDRQSKPPGITDVLGVVMNGPMDDVSLDSVEMVDKHFSYMKQLSDTVNACNKKLAKDCPQAKPVRNPTETNYSFAELSFDAIKDVHLRRCMQELPTTFSLPGKTVDLLRQTAGQLLMTSKPFIKGMQSIDPAWQPREVVIDKGLIAAVCGSE